MTKQIISQIILGILGTSALVGVGVSINEYQNQNKELMTQIEEVKTENNKIKEELEEVKTEEVKIEEVKVEDTKTEPTPTPIKEVVPTPTPAPTPAVKQKTEFQKLKDTIQKAVDKGKIKYTQDPLPNDEIVYFYFDEPREYGVCYEYQNSNKVACHIYYKPPFARISTTMVDVQVILDKLK